MAVVGNVAMANSSAGSDISLSQRNKSIDGWRGISVTLVIVSHVLFFRFGENWKIIPFHDLLHGSSGWQFVIIVATNALYRFLSPLGGIGVDFFFVISGFLITKLLISEEERNGSVSIAAFYVRRICRIMPAFYVFLFTVFVLWGCGLVYLSPEAFVFSMAYACNIFVLRCTWWLSHTWSLSVEEQFYLVWPVIFVLTMRYRPNAIVIVFIILIAGSLTYPDLDPFAYIAAGALVASASWVRVVVEKLATGPVIIGSLVILLGRPAVASLPLAYVATGALGPVLVLVILFGTVLGKGPLVPVVSMPAMQNIGAISYSLYLWQQLSTAPGMWADTETGAARLDGRQPLLLFLFIIPAMASYVWIERPAIALGARWSAWITGRAMRAARALRDQEAG
jgi:peptidoglycan/LPS O-acetylase OafA/YrhL